MVDKVSRYDNIDALLERVGQPLGTTGWHLVDQARINAIADTTGDHQWIHVDEKRAAAESPFQTTIAHGMLTLSLCATFLSELVKVDGVRLVINAGLNKVRLRAPVPVGSRVRGVATLLETRRMAAGGRVVVQMRVEVEGEIKPVCVADWVLVFHE
ncbi:Acyl dehydratase [Micromonospora cremea]|uniref:Acyl dehydratase n=1 Tax=Micromonospora cremea TaxID=709881 RepID=A0A1N6BET2_9ACTN|nr:Acyl dehydratase [Micromonospora cremea]